MAKKAVKKTVKKVVKKGQNTKKTLRKPLQKPLKKLVLPKCLPTVRPIFLPTKSAARILLSKKKSNDEEKVEVYPDEEQGILAEETSDEKKAKMKIGQKDEDIYTEEGREEEVEEDEIEPWEEGFMKGASGPGQLGKDALTGKPLMDVEDVVEMEINGKSYRFCNQKNAEKFRMKLEQEKKKGKRV